MRRLHQKRRLAWRSIAIALILLLPTGCMTVASRVVGAGASVVDAYYDYKGANKGEPVIVTEDAIASYNLAVEKLRERYLEDRLLGESAKEWLERMGQ